jgi:uncharacterized protein with HEPN domain
LPTTRRNRQVLHQLTVIGEATKRLSPEFRQAHPDVKWSEYAGLRDILIHQYDGVNLEWIWDAVQHDLPVLLANVKPLLPPRDGSING